MTFEIKQPKKREKREDSFQLVSEEEKNALIEKPENDDLYSMEDGEGKNQEIYEMNQDLEAEDSPIKIKDKYTLIVNAQGQEHEINRKDMAEFYRLYGNEDGSEENPLSSFRSLGTIHGERTQITDIYRKCNSMFGRLDGDNSLKTLPDEE